MTNPAMNDDELERELERKLAEIRERKQARETYLYDWQLAIEENERRRIKPCMISNIEIINDVLYFSASESRADVNLTIRNHKTTKFNYLDNKWSVDVPEWLPLAEKLKQLPSVYLKYGELNEKGIKAWKASAPFEIKLHKNYFEVKLGPKANAYLIRVIPGTTYDSRRLLYLVPLTEGWRLPSALKEVEGVIYSEEAQAYINDALTKRAKLDEIATKTEPAEHIELNGYKLRDFQSIAVEFAEAAQTRMINALEMGLGKTPCTIAVMERLAERGEGSKFLIIPPASLIPNWVRQVKQFTGFRAYVLNGSVPNNYDIAQVLAGKHRYYIINYDCLSEITKIPAKTEIDKATGLKVETPATTRQMWVEILNAGNFDAIAVDEAHYIKNVGSNRSRAVRDLVSPRWMLLTGTPLLNRPSELWPLIKVLDPDSAGAYESFVNHYTIDGKRARNVDELREILKPLMFRKVKKDVLKELPPINRITREYTLSSKAQAQYNKVVEGLWSDVDKWDGSTDNTTVITSILAQLLKMKQVCAWDKVDYIVELANELYEESTDTHRKVLIFSQFVNSPEVVKAISDKLNVTSKATGSPNEAIWFSGEMDVMKRQLIVNEFQANDNLHFLVAGIKSAREGLDITAAGSVIFADLDWTPANHHQAEARAYGRLNDLHSVNSYYVVSENTIEEDIMGLLQAKLELFNEIVEGAEASRDSSIVMELIKSLKERR
jgi:SNF2 family DNA or RNA helicase